MQYVVFTAVGFALAAVVIADPPASAFGFALVVLILGSGRFWDHAYAMRHQPRRWWVLNRVRAELANEYPPEPWAEPIPLTLAPLEVKS